MYSPNHIFVLSATWIDRGFISSASKWALWKSKADLRTIVDLGRVLASFEKDDLASMRKVLDPAYERATRTLAEQIKTEQRLTKNRMKDDQQLTAEQMKNDQQLTEEQMSNGQQLTAEQIKNNQESTKILSNHYEFIHLKSNEKSRDLLNFAYTVLLTRLELETALTLFDRIVENLRYVFRGSTDSDHQRDPHAIDKEIISFLKQQIINGVYKSAHQNIGYPPVNFLSPLLYKSADLNFEEHYIEVFPGDELKVKILSQASLYYEKQLTRLLVLKELNNLQWEKLEKFNVVISKEARKLDPLFNLLLQSLTIELGNINRPNKLLSTVDNSKLGRIITNAFDESYIPKKDHPESVILDPEISRLYEIYRKNIVVVRVGSSAKHTSKQDNKGKGVAIG